MHLKIVFCKMLAILSRLFFTNVSRALQNNLAKIYNARNHIYGDNFKLKLCMCAHVGTCTKFRLEILIRSTISAIHKFWENILVSARPQSVRWTHLCPGFLLCSHSELRYMVDYRTKVCWTVELDLTNTGFIGLSYALDTCEKNVKNRHVNEWVRYKLPGIALNLPVW